MTASPTEIEPNPPSGGPPPIPAESVDGRPFRADPLFHWIFLWISVAVLVLSFLLQVQGDRYVVTPLVNQPLPELCMLKRQTGFGCPGCGLTRCFVSIAHGEFNRAWRFNPAGLFFFGIVVFQLAYRPYQLHRIRSGRPELQSLWFNAAIWFLVACLFIQWLLRLTILDAPL